ncbi:MAG: RHS repeat-associated core domain-containing protein [Polyangiaceae bacterium]|nr:RHS repeat-associated core domain-containing protein [Polyangiaceae bacterium]
MALVSSTGTRYYHQNRTYHVMAMTNSPGQLAERYGYTPYGKRRVVSPSGATLAASAVGSQVGLTGRYHDGETGLTYFRARYMDAELGRFVGRDPIGYVDGASLYGSYFVPRFTDPSGNQTATGEYGGASLSALKASFQGASREARHAPVIDAVTGLETARYDFTFFYTCAPGYESANISGGAWSGFHSVGAAVEGFGLMTWNSAVHRNSSQFEACTLENGCPGVAFVVDLAVDIYVNTTLILGTYSRKLYTESLSLQCPCRKP